MRRLLGNNVPCQPACVVMVPGGGERALPGEQLRARKIAEPLATGDEHHPQQRRRCVGLLALVMVAVGEGRSPGSDSSALVQILAAARAHSSAQVAVCVSLATVICRRPKPSSGRLGATAKIGCAQATMVNKFASGTLALRLLALPSNHERSHAITALPN